MTVSETTTPKTSNKSTDIKKPPRQLMPPNKGESSKSRRLAPLLKMRSSFSGFRGRGNKEPTKADMKQRMMELAAISSQHEIVKPSSTSTDITEAESSSSFNSSNEIDQFNSSFNSTFGKNMDSAHSEHNKQFLAPGDAIFDPKVKTDDDEKSLTSVLFDQVDAAPWHLMDLETLLPVDDTPTPAARRRRGSVKKSRSNKMSRRPSCDSDSFDDVCSPPPPSLGRRKSDGKDRKYYRAKKNPVPSATVLSRAKTLSTHEIEVQQFARRPRIKKRGGSSRDLISPSSPMNKKVSTVEIFPVEQENHHVSTRPRLFRSDSMQRPLSRATSLECGSYLCAMRQSLLPAHHEYPEEISCSVDDGDDILMDEDNSIYSEYDCPPVKNTAKKQRAPLLLD